MSTRARIGIIGGGLMGREVASALGRWFVLENFPVKAELIAISDLVEKQREWFRQVPAVKLITADYHELLASPEVDIVYVAVPHNLHETIYLDVLKAGKDLLAEKPFGIDLKAARRLPVPQKPPGASSVAARNFRFFQEFSARTSLRVKATSASCLKSVLVTTTAAISIPTSR